VDLLLIWKEVGLVLNNTGITIDNGLHFLEHMRTTATKTNGITAIIIKTEVFHAILHSVSKRLTVFFVHNFSKCWPILKILSLLDITRNLQ